MSTSISYWLFRLSSALRWYRGASTRYDVHSPFLTEFIREVYDDDRYYTAFGTLRALRRYWRRRPGRVRLTDHGAPSRTTRGPERSVASLVRANAIGDREGRLLFRLAVWLRPRRLLEFGTNAGISTAYLHAADTRARLDSVEGNPAVAELARETFGVVGAGPGLRLHVGTFNDWLATHLATHLTPQPDPATTLDLFFLDGDHRYQPTLDYVRALLPHRSPNAVFVIADIHWSADMERAWVELRELPEVTASVDLYHFGLLFFRPGLSGPHLSLVRTRWKPWRVGFF